MFPAECTDAATFGTVSRSRDYTTLGNAKPVMEIEDTVFGQLRLLAFAPDGSFYFSDDGANRILCFSQNGLLLHSRTIATEQRPSIISITSDGYIWVITTRMFDESGIRLFLPVSNITILSPLGEQLCSLPCEWQDIGDRLRFVPLPNGDMLLTSFNEYYLNVFTSTGQPLWHSEKTTKEDRDSGNVLLINEGASTAVVDDQFAITYPRDGGALHLYPLHPQYKILAYRGYFPCNYGMQYDSTERVFVTAYNTHKSGYAYSVRKSNGSLLFENEHLGQDPFCAFKNWCISPNGLIYCSDRTTRRLMIF